MSSRGAGRPRAAEDLRYDNPGIAPLVDQVLPCERRVLDVGCGSGANMEMLRERGHAPVGITLSEVEARAVASRGLPCIVGDITAGALPFAPASFDALLFSHVLEHVAWPETVLEACARLLKPGGSVYVALPNVLQFTQRWQFLRGRFRYTDTGLMDRTHLRFFDLWSAREMVARAGFAPIVSFGVGMCPVGPLRESAPALTRRLDRLVSRLLPGLFAVHLVVVGRSAGKPEGAAGCRP
ncbi:MAG: class I SAM-dependent methyltransferase [Vicinamibacterales bacterium]